MNTFHNNPQQGSSVYLLSSDDSSSNPAWVERGKQLIDRLSNDLAIAPEDADDFDALNDETFGAATFDEDWEQQHEKMASSVSGPSQYQSPAGLSGIHMTTLPLSHPPSSFSFVFLNQNNLPCFDSSKVLDCQTIEQGMQNLSTSSRTGARHQHHDRSSNDDEYAGLMTQSNKEWLIKIQNSTLNFANPYKEDFYFVSFKTKQLATAAKAKKGDNRSKVPALIIPERKNDYSSKVEYVPVQFEGCLGILRVIDVKCPRKLLDVDPKHPTKIVDPSQDRPMAPIGRAELNAFRRLLLDIEHLYAIMLEIDEEDKKMGALPEFQRVPHVNRRSDLCNQLFRGVYDEQSENINQKIANVRKGIALIVRSLQVLSDSKQKAAIVKSLLDSNNSHYMTNYRDKGLHHLDFKETLTDVIASLKESQLPEIDLLSRKLNSTSFLN